MAPFNAAAVMAVWVPTCVVTGVAVSKTSAVPVLLPVSEPMVTWAVVAVVMLVGALRGPIALGTKVTVLGQSNVLSAVVFCVQMPGVRVKSLLGPSATVVPPLAAEEWML